MSRVRQTERPITEPRQPTEKGEKMFGRRKTDSDEDKQRRKEENRERKEREKQEKADRKQAEKELKEERKRIKKELEGATVIT